MKFTYTKITRRTYNDYLDEYIEDGIEFDYEVSANDLKMELKPFIERDYGDGAWQMIEDFDLVEEVAEYYRNELKDIFEKEAMEFYCD